MFHVKHRSRGPRPPVSPPTGAALAGSREGPAGPTTLFRVVVRCGTADTDDVIGTVDVYHANARGGP